MGSFNFFIGNDIELEIVAEDMNDFFNTVISCFRDLVVERDVNSIETRNISIDISDEDFPIGLFNELIFLFDRDGFVGNEVLVSFDGEKVNLLIKGERFSRDYVKRILKAATYHDYVFERDNKGIYVKMIVDI